MSEQLKVLQERQKSATAVPMLAERAVVLCGACPMAAFCKKQLLAPCDTPTQQVETIADEGGAEQVMEQVPKSYRAQLLDDSIDTVTADLQLKKKQPPKFVPKPPQHRQTLKATPLPTKRPHHLHQRRKRDPNLGSIGEAVADLFAVMIGREAVSATSRKR